MEKYFYWFQQHWVDVIIVSYVLFIIYTTIVPFQFIMDLSYLPHRLHEIDWLPRNNNGSIGLDRSDIVANIIFFIPLGLLLGLRKILRVYRRFYLAEWFKIILIGAFVSTCVEIFQIFTYNRSPGISDIVTNAAGTFLGALFIVLLYRKFHIEIKSFLFKFFAHKPEMIIAGIFLVFIFISQTAPFTFRINFYIVKRQIRDLLAYSGSFGLPIGELLTSLIIYGIFGYFLISGIQRYFAYHQKKKYYYYTALFMFIVPLFMEIFQLLVPDRYHSLVDVFLAEVGLALGAGFFLLQMRNFREENKDLSEIYQRNQINFFKLIGIVYLIFLIQRILLPVHLLPDWIAFKSILFQNIKSIYTQMKFDRLEFLISVIKQVFAFLPAGFIYAALWKSHSTELIKKSSLWLVVGLFPILLFLISVLITRYKMNILDIPAASMGIWIGIVCWQIYKFMIINVESR